MVLFDEQPIVINKLLAKKIGLNEAIVIQQLHYWIKNNKKANRNFKDEKFWTYNSIRQWRENEFVFWSEKTIERILKSLENKELIEVGNYNKDKRDKTKWYTINYKKLNNIYYDECIQTECLNGDRQNDRMDTDKMTEPLPESSTETTTENSINNNNTEKNGRSSKYDRIFKTYLESNIVKHTTLTTIMKDSINIALKKYTEEEIKLGIERYGVMLNDTTYDYCNYKWTLNEFLTRGKGLGYFLNEGDKWLNYLKHKKEQKQTKEEKQSDGFDFGFWEGK